MKKVFALLFLLCLTVSAALAESPETPSATTLVVYFSATGNTKPLAEYAAKYLSADLYEIVPAQPYTDADLNYNNNQSRSTLEHGDASIRPEIEGLIESIDAYDTIYLGYPIWWGEAPRIIDTFLTSFDFSGKTIIPFCTSASSGVGSSATLLHDLCSPETIWMDGTRFAIGTSESKITAWIDGLNAKH